MKVTIELNTFELKEANKRGMLDALTSLEVAKDKPETASQPETTPSMQPAPTAPLAPLPVLTQTPVEPTTAQAMPQTVVPTQGVSYTMEQLAKAAAQIVDAKGQQVILDLLGRFQVAALSMLPKEQYGAFATELRALGAKL